MLIAVAAGAVLCTLGHLGTLRLGGKAPLWTLGTEYPIGGSMQSVGARLGTAGWPAFAPCYCLCNSQGNVQAAREWPALLLVCCWIPAQPLAMLHPPVPLPRRRAGGGVRLCSGRHVDCALCHRDCGPAAVLWHAEVRCARLHAAVVPLHWAAGLAASCTSARRLGSAYTRGVWLRWHHMTQLSRLCPTCAAGWTQPSWV